MKRTKNTETTHQSKKRVFKEATFTKIINRDSAITEPPSGLVGIEISTVGKVVSTSESSKEIVVATVDRGVADDKESRDKRSLWD